jgi:release factor glutamine methyltransferase
MSLVQLCTDVNRLACDTSMETLAINCKGQTQCKIFDAVQADLVGGLRLNNKVDILIFNPPYVPTDAAEVGIQGIEAAWSGGHNGMQVTERLLYQVPHILTASGVFYLVCVSRNNPQKIKEDFAGNGYEALLVKSRLAGRERLSILRVTRQGIHER